MSREESPLEVEWVHPDVVRAITQERDEARGRLEKSEAKTRCLQEQTLNVQPPLDQADCSSREEREVLEQRFRSERRKRIKAEELAEELEVSNFRLMASIKSQANLLAEGGIKHEEEIELLKARNQRYHDQALKADARIRHLKVRIQTLKAENSILKSETEEAKKLESVTSVHAIEVHVQNLKTQLDFSNNDLLVYYAFTGFILQQESGLTEELEAWVESLPSGWQNHKQGAHALNRHSAQLYENMNLFEQELGQSDGLQAWEQSLRTHLDYCLKVANRFLVNDGVSDMAEKMFVYSQRLKSEEANRKIQDFNIQRDLGKVGYWPRKPSHVTTAAPGSPSTEKVVEEAIQRITPAASKTPGQTIKVGYWPINLSHGTVEAIPIAGSTSAKKVVENRVQERTPAAWNASGRIVKELNDDSGDVPLDEINEVQKAITATMPSTDDDQASRKVHKTRSPKLPEDIEEALIQKEQDVPLALPEDACQDVVVGDATPRDDHNILQDNNADVVSIENPATVKHLKKEKKKAKKYIHATWV